MAERWDDDTPGAATSFPVHVTSHALDVLLKLEAEHLVALLPARFGIALAPIQRHLPTELPQLDLHLQRLDRLFELTDTTILDLEFEAALSVADLRRFVGYGLGLLNVYPDHAVHTVAFCGPRTRSVPAPMDLSPIPYRLTCVLIGDQDGEATLARLRTLAASGEAWSDADRLDLVLLPLMRQQRDTETVVREGLELARALPRTDQPRAMGALLALAYHYEGEAVLNRLVEGLMSTNLLEEVFAEKMEQRFAQGVEQGIQQGVEQGIQQGVEQGIQQGVEQGIQQGVEQGIQQGMEQGRAEEARLLLRRYLERRFGAIPRELDERIATAGAEALTTLFDRAIAAPSIDAL